MLALIRQCIPLLGLATVASAQTCSRGLWGVTNPFNCSGGSCEYGTSIGTGDFNGDGFVDVVAGAHGVLPLPHVQVRSGADGSIMHEIDGAAGTSFGRSVDGVGDINGDGFDDFVVAAHRENDARGVIRIYSGTDATVLRTITGAAPLTYLGESVAAAGDVDADGIPDIIAGADSSNFAVVFSGATGLALHDYTNISAGAVSGLGDANGDGYDDFAVTPGLGGLGTIYSGIDGSVLHAIPAPFPLGVSYGRSLANAGDINGDGYGDLLFGDPSADGGPGRASGAVIVVSGVDGSFLHTKLGYAFNTSLGWSVGGGADINHDGHLDFAAGGVGDRTFGISSGRIDVFSGSDGALLFTHFGAAGDRMGTACDLADTNANGVAELLAGAFGQDFGAPNPVSGTITVLELDTAPWLEAPGSNTHMAIVGLPFTMPVIARDVSCDGGQFVLGVTGTPPAATHAPALPATTTGISPELATQFTWTPTNADVGTHTLTYTVIDSAGTIETVPVTIEVAECFLLLGGDQANVSLGGLDRLLVDFTWSAPITTTSVPAFTVPNLPGFAIYAQVAMFNPFVFPNDPLQLSHGMQIVIANGCTNYGVGGSNLRIALTQAPTPGNTVSFGVVIPPP